MTRQQQQNLMANIFGSMMTAGYLREQQKMSSILKAIHYLLGIQEHLSPQECDDCLLFFFREYAKGCRQPISDAYIRTNMIPVLKNYPDMDILWGNAILKAAQMG